MAESIPSVRDALAELRVSTERLRVAATRALSRAWTDATTRMVGSSPGAANGTDESAAPGTRTHRLLAALRARRVQVLGAVEEHAGRLTAQAVRRLPMASQADVAKLRRRIAALERRLDARAANPAVFASSRQSASS